MKYKSIYVQAQRATYEKEGIFSGKQVEASEQYADGPDLALRCQAACNALHEEGYEVISINEVIGGTYKGMHHGGAGWSLTSGYVVTARRM